MNQNIEVFHSNRDDVYFFHGNLVRKNTGIRKIDMYQTLNYLSGGKEGIYGSEFWKTRRVERDDWPGFIIQLMSKLPEQSKGLWHLEYSEGCDSLYFVYAPEGEDR